MKKQTDNKMTIVLAGYAYILIGLVVLFLNAHVHAATYKWIGGEGGLWSSTSNWKNTAKQSIIQNKKPNVVFIAIDDLNDWVGALGGYKGKVHTPNIDALAKKGMLFTRAYAASTVCNPSRVALWTGKRPSTTGVYGQYGQWDDNRTNVKTIFRLFKENGYDLYGGGKIFHHDVKTVHSDPSFNRLVPFINAEAPKTIKKTGWM